MPRSPSNQSIGSKRLDTLYSRNNSGKEHVTPLNFEELRQEALEKLPSDISTYISTGAGTGVTKRENVKAFQQWKIVPRILRTTQSRTLETEVAGQKLPTPLFVAPMGGLGKVREKGEISTVKGAGRVNVPIVLSAASSVDMESVAEAADETPKWFQLYPASDLELTKSLLHRAEDSGYSAIVVTVDTPSRGWRAQEITDGYSVYKSGSTGFGNYFSDNNFRKQLDPVSQIAIKFPSLFEIGKKLMGVSPIQNIIEKRVKYSREIIHNSSLTWEDIETINEISNLPVFVKGVLHPADAEEAVERDLDGIIVSNHGGNHIDGAITSIDVLPKIVERVGGQTDILFDSGIRNGTHVFKAVALGADAVFVGRPVLYGLAAAGEKGVYEVLANILAELDITLANSGHAELEVVNRSSLASKIDRDIEFLDS